jgi:hypothetical protein
MSEKRLELKSSGRFIVVLPDGKEIKMNRPNLGMVTEHEERLEAAKATGLGSVKAVVELLAACGMPVEDSRGLDPEHLELVVGMLMPAKKN